MAWDKDKPAPSLNQLKQVQKQLRELALMVIDEMSDPSPELAKLLIKYSK